MMAFFDFDTPIPRTGTDCYKWDGRRKIFGTEDLLPMWVADMDFAAPPAVREALARRVAHGVYGYTMPSAGYHQAVAQWLGKRHGWPVDPCWCLDTPGVVPALNFAVQAFTRPGDGVIIQPPVYPPFFSCVKKNGRRLLENPLVHREGRYEMDFADLEAKARGGAKLLILSHPHNPVGRVWSREELTRMVEICRRHGLVILSDEIHSDLIFRGHKHIPVASLSEEAAAITVTCLAASKTFNIAGLAAAVAVIADAGLRKAFREAMEKTGIHSVNLFGMAAQEAAYRHGEPWLEELLAYLEANADYLVRYMAEHIPRIKVKKPEATYLAWLDCRELGLDQAALKDFFIRKAKVGLNDGITFGREGEGFMRLNFGCPRKVLEEGLERIGKAVNP